MSAASAPYALFRTILMIGLLIGAKHCSGQLRRSESAEVGRRVQNYDARYQQQPAHELGFGYYYQGDIMLPTEPQSQDRLSIAEEHTSTVWPNGIVPYYIPPGEFNPREINIIERSMNVFHTKTCVRFVPRTPDTRYYVQITNRKAGCYATIGRVVDNRQNVMNLQSPGCLSGGTPMHEMMHILGYLHEVSRPDRDDYIYVNRSALEPRYQSDSFYQTNFAKFERDVETYNIDYNYGSIMHYTRYAGARDRKYPVLMHLKPYDEPDFGNNTLSPSDIESIQFRYCRNATGLFWLQPFQQFTSAFLGVRSSRSRG
ncbi:hatching enzyme 1.2-like [Anopheles marshallii]|uniref:hatching enzyme 1.2-like n=1 Tax=Anopheles marshallii TaxID=1521116 RepID=UPI00237AA5E4|nr:hatching enzyme 1.2-like [Anopheles marshallii]